ncbi:MAG: serine/threonine-protein kinase [Myxococcaceae bacterium]
MDTGEKSFGKYVLLHKIAAGGMAVTYRARMAAAAGVTKEVVIKKIHPHLAEEEDFVHMFIGEAQLTAQLTHSNIAQVFDFGELNGEYFLAMEWVQGQALSRVLRRAADRDIPFLPGAVALQIAIKMCEGLHYAHTRKDDQGRPMGLVHRDVSPENTLVSYEGEVKIIDFGIAKAARGGKQTETGLVKGKYPYFSPEQAQAQRDLDARSDVYAVGVVLFEMFCGRRPYEGEFVAVLTQITSGKIPRPMTFNPGIPQALEDVMLKALAVNRDERYQSCRDLGNALSQVLHARYPGSTTEDVASLLGTLFEAELQAEGLELPVPPAFRTALEKTKVPGYGEKRRQQLGLKPDVPKATPRTPARPVSATATPGPGVATPGKTRSSISNRVISKPNGTDSDRTRPPSKNLAEAALKKAGDKPNASESSKRGVATGMRRPGMLRAEDAAEEAKQTRVQKEREADPDTTPVPAKLIQVPKVQALSLDTPELQKRRNKLVVSIAAPVIGVSMVLFLVYFIFHDSSPRKSDMEQLAATGSVWLSTKPAGATVTIDGKNVGVTPVETTVPAGIHNIAVTMKGYRPWTHREPIRPLGKYAPQTIALEPDGTIEIPPEVVDAGPAKVPDKMAANNDPATAKNEGSWPLRLFVVRLQSDTLPLNEYQTATYDMNPKTAYQISTDGSYTLSGNRRTSDLYYYLEGPTIAQKARFGVLKPAGMTVKNATKMHVFMLDDHPEAAKGEMRINIRISQYVAPTSFSFDAALNTFAPTKLQRYHLGGLNPSSEYLLTLRPDEPEVDETKNGSVTEVFCRLENAGPPQNPMAANRFWEVGKRARITGATDAYCMIPDVSPENNSGAIEIDIVDMAELSNEDLEKLGEKRSVH